MRIRSLISGVGLCLFASLFSIAAFGAEEIEAANDLIFNLAGEDINHDGSEVVMRASIVNATEIVIPSCEVIITFPQEGQEMGEDKRVNEFTLVPEPKAMQQMENGAAGCSDDDPMTYIIRTGPLQPGEAQAHIFHAHAEYKTGNEKKGKLTAYIDVLVNENEEDGTVIQQLRTVREVPFYFPASQPAPQPAPQPPEVIPETRVETMLDISLIGLSTGEHSALDEHYARNQEAFKPDTAQIFEPVQSASSDDWKSGILWIYPVLVILLILIKVISVLNQKRKMRIQEHMYHFEINK